MARITVSDITEQTYEVYITKYGFKAVDTDTVTTDRFNYSTGNSKLGEHVLNYGMDIMHTCANCECKSKGNCYGVHGLFQFGSNMQRAAENFMFWFTHGAEGMLEVMQRAIDANADCDKFRHFEIGDIPNRAYLESVMIPLAIQNPGVKFWTYTKKYEIVNKYVDECGLDAIPSNLTIVFSHWMNEDGSYFPMDNRHDFPTSEFIPMGKEAELLPGVTHVCPCSDPNTVAHCETCDHPCHSLKHGESMALLEHSTKATVKRDRELKKAHKALKAS